MNNTNTQIDYSAFESKVSIKDTVKTFFRTTNNPGFSVIASAILIIVFIFIIFSTLISYAGSINTDSGITIFLIPISIALIATFSFGYAIFRIFTKAKSNYRLEKFCKSNNYLCVFNGFTTSNTKKGLVYEIGSSQQYDSLVDTGLANVGMYSFVTGSGRSRRVNKFVVATKKLNRKFPHIVFDNKKNNFFMTNLPTSFSKDQKISLEGNFDDYFSTYVPENYHIDVLSFVTPELMEVLIKYCSNYDIEIVDDEIYVYSQQSINYKKDFTEFMTVLDEISKEFNQNAKHYRDDRVVAFGANSEVRSNTISVEGKRLKKSFKPILIILGIYVLFSISRVVLEQYNQQFALFGIIIVIFASLTIFKIIRKLKK